MNVNFSDGKLGQVEVMGQTDQGDAIKAHRCANAEGRTTGLSFCVINTDLCLKLSECAVG